MRRKKRNPCDKDTLRKYVWGLLRRRPYPISVIRKKMKSRGCSDDVVDEVMVQLKELLNENMLIEQYLESLYLGALRKGKGPYWFRERALNDGIPEEMVNSYIEGNEWKESLRVCVMKGKARYKGDLSKLKAYIYRNGFPLSYWDMALEMLKEG